MSVLAANENTFKLCNLHKKILLQPSDAALANAICLSHIVDVMLKRSGMSPVTVAIAESAAAAQKLRREAEKGIMFRTRAGRVVQARRVVKGMNIGGYF